MKNNENGNPIIKVTYLNTNEEKKFHTSWGTTLMEIMNKAYQELGEMKKDKDILQSEDGTDLTPYLSLTLEQLREQHIAINRHFQIKCETGGASYEY